MMQTCNTYNIQTQGVGYYKLKKGEHIIRSYKNPDGTVEKIVSGILEDIIEEWTENCRSKVILLKIKGYEKDFSQKKFKRFHSPILSK